MTRFNPRFRPRPRFEDGYFIPSVPIPNPRATEDYRWYHSLTGIREIVRNPLETFNEDEFRDPVTQFQMLHGHFTFVNDPDFIKYCFLENRENYGFSEIRQRILRAILGDGLISAEGKKWSHARRLMSPMFTPKNIKIFASDMQATTMRELPKLFKEKQVQKIAGPMSALTYLVLSDTLFSGDIAREQQAVLRDVSTALTYMGRPDPLDLIGAPDWVPRLTRLRGLKAVKNLRSMIRELIHHRKTGRDAGEELPDDFLSRLLLAGHESGEGFSNIDIEDHLLAFIGAGHETTARALSWLFYLLSNDRQSREQLEAEVDALDVDTLPPESWGDHLPFTLACFEETMRLFPPAPFIFREAKEEDKFGDIIVPAKGVLFLNTWILHRHKKLWERPNAFMPDRFLSPARDKIGRFQYLPFGVGERVCIGQRFAMQEAAILIALLARSYRFDYAGKGVPWPKMRITVQPENGMPMRVTKRPKTALGKAA